MCERSSCGKRAQIPDAEARAPIQAHWPSLVAKQTAVLGIGSLSTIAESCGLEELFAFGGHVFPEEVAGFAHVAEEFLRRAVFEALVVGVDFVCFLGAHQGLRPFKKRSRAAMWTWSLSRPAASVYRLVVP